MYQGWEKLISLVTTALSTVFSVTIKDAAGDSAMDGTNDAVRVNVVTGSLTASLADAPTSSTASSSSTGNIVTHTVGTGHNVWKLVAIGGSTSTMSYHAALSWDSGTTYYRANNYRENDDSDSNNGTSAISLTIGNLETIVTTGIIGNANRVRAVVTSASGNAVSYTVHTYYDPSVVIVRGPLPSGARTLGAVNQAGTWTTSGNVVHDDADSGNPLKIGAKAKDNLTDITLVADNDRANAISDLDGAIIFRQDKPHGDYVSSTTSNTDGASTAATSFAADANNRWYITDVAITNMHATTTVYVDIRDGTAGAVLFTLPVPAVGGVVHQFKTPLRGSANTAVAFDPSAAVTTLYVSLSGYKSKA